jgi:hypothetical protein
MWEQDNSIIQEVIKFPNVLFTCSADNIGSKFEYIRRGASWDRFDRNLRFLQQHSNIEIRINSVFFVLSALELIDTINYFAKHYNIDNFTINQCGMGQTHLRCRNLSDILKERVKNNIQQAIINYSNNQNLIGQFTNCLEELTHIKTENYLDYFVNIDKLQGSSFEKTFLELI